MSDKNIEDMEKFMTILMDVKVSLAEQNGKLDSLLDVRKKVDIAYDTAMETKMRSIENDKSIKKINENLNGKAAKEEIKQLIKERENWQRNLPSWLAVIISIIALLLKFL